MRIGALLLPTDPWKEMVDQALALEESGFDHLWVYDHMTWRRYRESPWHSSVVWLAGMAAVTSTIRLGTMVLNPNIRDPLSAAKDFVGLDHLSDGRMVFGVGAGGVGFDATVLGQPVLSPGNRIERLAEFVEVLDRLWSGEPVDHSGEYYRLLDALVLPRAVQSPRIPVLVAAGRPRGLALTARAADGWITWGDTTLGDLTELGTERIVAEQMRRLRSECDGAGRDFESLDRVFLIGNTETRPLRSIDEFLRFAERYASMGFTDIVFHHPRLNDPVWADDPAVVSAIAGRLEDLRAL